MKIKGYIIGVILISLFKLSFGQTTLDKIYLANELYYSNPDSSYLICKEVETKLKGTRNQIEIAEAQLCQARYLLLKTRFDESTALLNKAMPVFEEEKRVSSLAKCHSLKAILLDRISNTEEAIYHQRKSLELYAKANDKQGQINTLSNLALDFLDLQQNDSALYYLIKLKGLEEKMDNTSRYFMHQNFGHYYYNVRDFQPAIKSYNKALSIAENEQMIDSKATCLMLLSDVYIATKNYVKAEELLNQSIEIAQANKLLHETNESYVKLIELYEKQGNYKKAFEKERLNDKIEKEIYNLDKINKINEIESQLKLTEKENIIAQKELDLKNEQLNTVEAKSKVTQLFFVIALFFIIIVFVIFILVRARKLNAKINLQKMMLEEKNTEITDSINYAKRIQSAILPSTDIFKHHLPQSFIFYKPKDIVAGDFYWLQTIEENVLFAAADCTGHGVPGALVSVVCSNSLNQSLKELKTISTSKILEKTRTLVKDQFNTGDEKNVNDGMDIALCSINKSTNEIIFTGANNPLWIVRNNELIEIKGDKQPVGKHFKEKPFTEHKYQLEKNDMLYVFSDGYADQFGGPKGKKFMYKQLKNLFISISSKNIEEQHQVIANNFDSWKGDLEQLDDVCILGIRI